MKIDQGSLLENLKSFMYLTNTYGVPPAEYIDLFVDTFKDDIFAESFDRIKEDDLNKFWSKHQEIRNTGGSEFYKSLVGTSIDSGWYTLSVEEKIKKLRTYIEGVWNEMSSTFWICNTPELIKEDAEKRKYIDIEYNRYGLHASARLYKDRVLILVGSTAVDIKDSCNYNLANRLKKLRSNGYIVNNIVVKNIEVWSITAASNVVYGSEANGWNDWVNCNNESVEKYRNFMDYKRYRLKPEYSMSNNDSLVGCYIYFN